MYGMPLTLHQAHVLSSFIEEKCDEYVEELTRSKFQSPNADQTQAGAFFTTTRSALMATKEHADKIIAHAKSQSGTVNTAGFMWVPYDMEEDKQTAS